MIKSYNQFYIKESMAEKYKDYLDDLYDNEFYLNSKDDNYFVVSGKESCFINNSWYNDGVEDSITFKERMEELESVKVYLNLDAANDIYILCMDNNFFQEAKIIMDSIFNNLKIKKDGSTIEFYSKGNIFKSPQRILYQSDKNDSFQNTRGKCFVSEIFFSIITQKFELLLGYRYYGVSLSPFFICIIKGYLDEFYSDLGIGEIAHNPNIKV